MTVPFIMALGVGVSRRPQRQARRRRQLRSGGPVLHRPHPDGAAAGPFIQARRQQLHPGDRARRPGHRGDVPLLYRTLCRSISRRFWRRAGPHCRCSSCCSSCCTRRLNRRPGHEHARGLPGYTYVGLVLFLTGVNVGFMPVGNFLGQQHRLPGVQLGADPHRHGHRLLHRRRRSLPSTSSTARWRRSPPASIPASAMHIWPCRVGVSVSLAPGHDPGADGHLHHVVPGAGLCPER